MHGGNAELTEQVLNAGVKPTPYGWRAHQGRQDDLKIDAAVALVIAVYLAEAEASPGGDPHVITV